jgi:hypothetical protein
MGVRHTIPLILLRDDIVEGLEIVELNGWKVCPFRVRLESGPKLPFAGMSRGGDQTSRALFGGLTPFVFLHDSWNQEACDGEPLSWDSPSSDAVVRWTELNRR